MERDADGFFHDVGAPGADEGFDPALCGDVEEPLGDRAVPDDEDGNGVGVPERLERGGRFDVGDALESRGVTVTAPGVPDRLGGLGRGRRAGGGRRVGVGGGGGRPRVRFVGRRRRGDGASVGRGDAGRGRGCVVGGVGTTRRGSGFGVDTDAAAERADAARELLDEFDERGTTIGAKELEGGHIIEFPVASFSNVKPFEELILYTLGDHGEFESVSELAETLAGELGEEYTDSFRSKVIYNVDRLGPEGKGYVEQEARGNAHRTHLSRIGELWVRAHQNED
ncbi:hypothetical protein J2754_001642 [Halarchaeum solikamskense]|uniref:HFX_2341 family transcriptional regulator domain-containing protein n=1 Tax=Halarchaeum nitratireducens TaxID=489913 RepID=UPI00315B179E|nr:hypothetical protein [Halarchaeum solikamskense]